MAFNSNQSGKATTTSKGRGPPPGDSEDSRDPLEPLESWPPFGKTHARAHEQYSKSEALGGVQGGPGQFAIEIAP